MIAGSPLRTNKMFVLLGSSQHEGQDAVMQTANTESSLSKHCSFQTTDNNPGALVVKCHMELWSYIEYLVYLLTNAPKIKLDR